VLAASEGKGSALRDINSHQDGPNHDARRRRGARKLSQARLSQVSAASRALQRSAASSERKLLLHDALQHHQLRAQRRRVGCGLELTEQGEGPAQLGDLRADKEQVDPARVRRRELLQRRGAFLRQLLRKRARRGSDAEAGRAPAMPDPDWPAQQGPRSSALRRDDWFSATATQKSRRTLAGREGPWRAGQRPCVMTLAS